MSFFDVKGALADALGTNQGTSQFELRIGPFVGGQLTVVSFTGHEALSQPFLYEVVFASSVPCAELEAGVLGFPACLSIHAPKPHEPRIIQGLAVGIEAIGSSDAELSSKTRRYMAQIAPRLWLAQHQRRSRVFQGKTAVQIAKAVLDTNAVKYDVNVDPEDYPVIAFEYQRDETDLEFLHRVLSTAGLFYYFRHATGLLDQLLPPGAGDVVGSVGALAGTIGGLAGGAAAGVTGFVSDVESSLGMTTTLVLTDRAISTEALGDSSLVGGAVGGVASALSAGFGAASGKLTGSVTGSVTGSFGGIGGSVMGAVGVAAGIDGAGSALVFDGNGQAASTDTERVFSFKVLKAIRPKQVNLRSWNLGQATAFTASDASSAVSANVSLNLSASLSLSGVKFGASASEDFDTDALPIAPSAATVFEYQRDLGLQGVTPARTFGAAQRALLQARSDAMTTQGETDCRRLAPGYRFTLAGHPIDNLNKEYLVLETRSQGYSPDQLPDPEASDFRSAFRCVPSKVDPKPKKPEGMPRYAPEAAIVVGPTWGDIHCDSLGRILVRFRWADANTASASDEIGEGMCWVHWLERWGGDGYGTQTLPRVGTEVLVDFHTGGEPIAVGQLRSRANMPAFPLPREATKVGIRSRTIPNGAQSEISIDDNPSSESVLVRATGDFNTEVARDTRATLGGTYDLTVAGERREATGGDTVLTFAKDATTGVVGNLREEVGKDRIEIVLGSVSEYVEGDVARAVVGAVESTTQGTHSETFAADAITRHLGHHAVVVAAPGTTGKASAVLHVEGAARAYAKGEIEAVTPTGFTLTCGDSYLTIRKDSITLCSPTISLNGKMVQVTASDTAAVAAKTATVSGSDSVTVSGAKTATVVGESASVVLDSNATVQGTKVNLGSGGNGAAASQSQGSTTKTTTITLVDTEGNALPNERAVLRKGADGGEERVVVLDGGGSIDIDGQDPLSVLFPDFGQQVQATSAMRPYVVRQGDYLLQLAMRYGFDADAVWNSSKNDDLRKLRGDPNILQPGDVLYIPQGERAFMAVTVGAVNRFVGSVPKTTVTLTFKDRGGTPIANAACTYLGLPGVLSPDDFPPTTDSGGVVKLRVRAHQGPFIVELPDHKARITVLVGQMDPVREASGAAKRLQNLGYGTSPLLTLGMSLGHYDRDVHAERNIRSFQSDKGLPVTGELDPATLDALKDAHGS